MESRVVVIEDVVHIFYGGSGEDINGIGDAVSSDGLSLHRDHPTSVPRVSRFSALKEQGKGMLNLSSLPT